MFLDFIEIGTSDFDTEIQKNDNKKGISIDAVKFYIDRLPNKKNCLKLNCGISNFNGKIKINYVSIENIKKYNLPDFVRGCNSVNTYHPTVVKLLNQKNIDLKNAFTTYEVDCKTLISLYDEYKLNGTYLLKVDTEGHDCVILKHFLTNVKYNHLLPHNIIFETNNLSNIKDIQNIWDIANSLGYELVAFAKDFNTIFRLNLHKMKRFFHTFLKIQNYYIEGYPENYDPKNLPHENTLDDAKNYCKKYKYTGITYENGRYEVRNGNYIEYKENKELLTWVQM